MSFYSNFISLCNSHGKTPSRVVLDIGLKKSAVTRWKSGGLPTDATAQKIADYFGVSSSELTENQKEKAPAPGGEPMDPITKELLEIVKTSNNDERLALLEAARWIRKQRKES